MAIDDYETHHLRTLIEQECPSLVELGVVAVRTNPSGRPTLTGFRTQHDYALFYGHGDHAHIAELEKSEAQSSFYNETDKDGKFAWVNLRKRGGANTRRAARPKQFYPIYVQGEKIRIPELEWDKAKRKYKPLSKPKRGEKRILPISPTGEERIWSLSPKTAASYLKKRELKVDGVNPAKPQILRKQRPVSAGSQPNTFWDKADYSTVEHGSVLLANILGAPGGFNFPKSLYTVLDCLRVAGANPPNSLILDFFAGSGTTFHATALLNARDGGDRRCILVTNNEVDAESTARLAEQGYFPGDKEFEASGICEAVTWPRCKAVIEGKRADKTELPGNYLREDIDGNLLVLKDGLAENLEYFRLDFVDPNYVARGDAYKAILPILWVISGCRGLREDSKGSKPWFLPQSSPFAVLKVVLFKTALTTGWDCPRAEVMMSFRRSVDATTIAQLVGRMIRTPLARRIESDEALNTVDLYLPHYDTKNLESVLNALRNPESLEGPPTKVTTKAVEYPRNPSFAAIFEHLATLKTYSVNRAPKMSDRKRALRLSGMLMQAGIDKDADEKLRITLTNRLAELRDGYEKTVKDWNTIVREGGEIEVDVTSVLIGSMNVTDSKANRIPLTAENIDRLFDEAGRMLAAGEGLHRTYWKRFQDKTKPAQSKLELFAIVQQAETLPAMEKLSETEFKKLWDAHKVVIASLSASEKSRFQQLVLASGKAVELDWELPERIVEKPGKYVWKNHMFSDENGDFAADLNGWETAFMQWTEKQSDFMCWLRNLPRRDWAFCVPYEKGGEKPFYPDMIIVRKKGAGYVVDILEPHDDNRLDTWAKVKGLAKFADEHGMTFGRLMVGRKVGHTLQVIDVVDRQTREKARKMEAPADLQVLFTKI